MMGVWNEYLKGQEYLNEHNVYEQVKTNELMYVGKQWDGVNAPNLPKPVINIIKRVVKYFIATISTNDVVVSIEPFSVLEDDLNKIKPVKEEIEKLIERTNLKSIAKTCIRNSAVDGSAYVLQMFDNSYDTGQFNKGIIKTQIVDNTNVYFGNPYSSDIQSQPYIIISLRQHISNVKNEARALGLSEDVIESIREDDDTNQFNSDNADNLVTVLLKFHKETKTIKTTEVLSEGGIEVEIETEKKVTSVWFTKQTKNVVLIEDRDLGYKRYPIACMGWEPVKNSYLFESPITEVVDNQIFVNKSYAIAQMYGLQSAFPKVVYDRNKVHIDKIMNTSDPVAVTNMDTMGKILDFIKVPDFSNNILALIDSTISQTKECMGANDVSLGNVKPDNTSAIIALQEASNVPLELQKQSFYQFWEDMIRNCLDIMSFTYGVREFITEVDGEKTMGEIDFDFLQNFNYELNVDIGNGAQFSEISQINTLDKLLANGIIDAKTYVELVPQKYIPGKQKILSYLDSQLQAIKSQQALDINAQPQANSPTIG